MKKKLFSLMIILAFYGAVFGQACSEYGMMSGDQSSEANFGLSASSTTLAAGAQMLISPSGGTAPYTFSVNYGGGTITANGLFTAPATVTPTNNSVIIQCIDALGNEADLTLYVISNALTAAYSPSPASPGQSILITILGGTPPYTIQKLTGAGTVNGNYYMSSSTTVETATFQIFDGTGIGTNLSIPIGSTPGAYSSLTVTPLGSHVVGGNGCTSPYAKVGQVADAGGNYLQGDQEFCAQSITATLGSSVITDIQISPSSPGAGSAACASGYGQVGSVAYCSGGSCLGSQVICVKTETMTGTTRPVLEFKVTTDNIHTSSPSCGSLTAIGYTTDCGYGRCDGYQAFCVRK